MAHILPSSGRPSSPPFNQETDMGTDTLFVHETKRQQAAALQALRACHRTLHLQQRVKNHWDQRALSCDGVAGHISQPGVTEGPGECWSRGSARQSTLVPATPGCGMFGLINPA